MVPARGVYFRLPRDKGHKWKSSLNAAAMLAILPNFVFHFISLCILTYVNRTCGFILLVSRTAVMINRDSRGHQYSIVRGEILGFIED